MDDKQNDAATFGMQEKPIETTPPPEKPSEWLGSETGKNVSPSQSSSADIGSSPPAGPSQINKPLQNPETTGAVQPQVDPGSAMTNESIVGPHSTSGGGGFKAFVIIGIVVILAIWAGVAYLFIQNRGIKSESGENITADVPDKDTVPEFSPEQIKIKSGSIIREYPGGDTVILVDKENYESTGITGFLKVAVSPDNSKMCFESWPPAPEPALYISDIDGQNLIEASPNRQSCVWSKDSAKVFYINTASNSAPVNIFEYELSTSTESDLTGDFIPAGVVRRYEIVGLSADGTKIICKFEDLGGAATSDTVNECEVDLESGEVSSL